MEGRGGIAEFFMSVNPWRGVSPLTDRSQAAIGAAVGAVSVRSWDFAM